MVGCADLPLFVSQARRCPTTPHGDSRTDEIGLLPLWRYVEVCQLLSLAQSVENGDTDSISWQLIDSVVSPSPSHPLASDDYLA